MISGLIWLICAILFYGLVVPVRMAWRLTYYTTYYAMLLGGAYIVYCAAYGFGQGYFGP